MAGVERRRCCKPDASIITIAERLNQTVIASLDERDFRIVRPAHTDAFQLLPEPA